EEYKRFTSDDKLMRAYAARDAFLVGQKMMLSREREEGIKEGMEKGIKDEKYSIAKNLKKSGLDIKFISENTGLSIEEIENL
ncbi:ATPase, partial [Brachyspira catarrhinii]